MAKSAPFRSAYDGGSRQCSDGSSLHHFSRSLTHQSFLEECDINRIVRQVDVSGLAADPGRPAPRYFDASSVLPFQDALNQVIAAQDAFDALPAKVRARFGNDPAQFVDFLQDPDNVDEAVKLGLAEPRPVPEPVVPPAEPPAPSAEE